jgi:hypothetical protein
MLSSAAVLSSKWIKVGVSFYPIIAIYIVMFNVRLLQRWLLVVVPIIGASMLATYFLGFVIGFISNMFMFIVVILYIQRKKWKEFGFNDEQEGYYGGRSSNETKPSYLCLSCGSKVNGRTCDKCGSHMKKGVFK